MKKIVLALGILGAASTAQAADMRARMPMKAPPMAVAIYNWTGFYIGAHVGGGFSHSDATTTVTTTGAFSSGGAGFGRSNDSKFLGGGQIGYNWQVSPNWVLGVEADISGTNIRNGYLGTTGNVPGAASAAYSNRIDMIGTVRGRIGYAWNNTLVYATGGYAWADQDISRLQVSLNAPVPNGTAETIGRTADGYVVGGGLEYGFTPNWSAKLEYNYIDLGRDGVNFTNVGTNRTTSFDTEIHAVKFGINYRFGGLGY